MTSADEPFGTGQIVESVADQPAKDYENRDLKRLISQYPLAWVCSENNQHASLLPLLGVFSDRGELVELIGHFARHNPLNDVFRTPAPATVYFTGPHGYISPSQAGRRNWGPTWNYAQARIWGEAVIDEALTPEAIDWLVDHMEKGRADPWTAQELGPRYDLLMPLIIAFRVKVNRVSAVFKLGQTEDDPTFASILSNLPDTELRAWMEDLSQRPLRQDIEP